ncbi:MAG: chemotaxis protein CheX [Gemmataceae bacterium]|nr:chemotaxis protein CheX [Gemmataceae bacterium]
MAETLSPSAAAVLPEAVETAVRAAAAGFFGGHLGLDPAEVVGDSFDGHPAAITAVISFFGDPVFSVMLGLPEATAVAVAEKFCGFEVPFDGPDMGDLVGELVNVMAGEITARLEAGGKKAPMSLPTVARGRNVELLPPADARTERLAYTTAAGGFWLKLVRAGSSHPGTRRSGL